MIVGIHQPNYFPGISYFGKIINSDIFVILTSVQFTKGNWINRNRIKTAQGELLLTVPVLTKGKLNQKINEVRINNRVEWRNKHLKTIIQNYRKTPYLDKYKTLLEDAIRFDTVYLSELNINLIKKICTCLGITTKFVIDTEIVDKNLKSTNLLVDLVKTVGGKTYISGIGGKKYMEVGIFSAADIDLRYSIFEPVKYTQKYGNFISNLSIIDLIMNKGPNSLEIIKKSVRIEK
jgi:hypothetical protein